MDFLNVLLALVCAMPVNWVKVEMPLGGVNALSDPVHVLPGKMLSVFNGRFDQPGGISKRPGFEQRSNQVFAAGSSTVPTGARLAEMPDGEQLLFSNRNLYAWETHSAGAVNQWVDRGRPGDAAITSELNYFDAQISVWNLNIAEVNGLRLTCWFSGTFSYIVQAGPTTLVKGSNVALVEPLVVGNNIWAFDFSGFGAADIRWGFINTTLDDPLELTFSTASFASPALSTNFYDLTKTAAGAGTTFVVLFSDNTDGTSDLHVSRRNATNPPTQIWNADLAVAAAEIKCTAVHVSDGFVWVAWATNNDLRMIVLNESNGTVAGANASIDAQGNDIVRIAITRFNSSQVIVCWEMLKGTAATPPSARLPYVRWAIVNTTPTEVGSIHLCSDVMIAAKPFLSDSQVYLPVIHVAKGYGHGFLIQIAATTSTTDALDPSWRGTYAREIATAEQLDASNLANQDITTNGTRPRGHVPNVAATTPTGTVAFPIRSSERFSIAKLDDSQIIIRHCGVRTVSVGPQLSQRNWVHWGAGMFISSGRPSWYDGFQVGEHGFAWAPSLNRDTEDDLTFPAGVGVGFPPNSFINVQLVWHFQDVNGQIQQSEPSVIFGGNDVLIAVDGQSFSARLRNTLLTDRDAGASAWWTTGITKATVQTYRVTAGVNPGLAAGTIFYRTKNYAGWPIPSHGTATVAPAENIPIGITQDEHTPDIENNEVIYTTGGILPNTGTPPAEVCHVHGNRLWLAQLEDPHIVLFSQPFVVSEAPRFNTALSLRFDEPIYALGTLDDKLIATSATSIFVVNGKGPPASGDIEIGFQIERIASDVGCKSHRSMVSTSMGLMFYAQDRGFMLLDRSGQLQEIGAPVRQFLTSRLTLANPTDPIRGTALLTDKTQVRWVVNIFDGSESFLYGAFVYDYRVGEWNIDRSSFTAQAVDAIAFKRKDFTFLDVFGRVFDEDTPALDNMDNGTFIPLLLETPWIRLDTIQGWQRLRSIMLLGTKPANPGKIDLAIAYDYNPTYTQGTTFSRAEILALPTNVLQLKWRAPRQKCEAFRIAIVDSQDSGLGTNQGLRISSIVFEAGVKRGTAKLAKEFRK